MGHVADGLDVDGGLTADDFWRQGCQLRDVQVGQILLGEVRLARCDRGQGLVVALYLGF